MVRDRHDAVAKGSERAPRTLRQPAEASPPLEHLSVTDAVVSLRRVRESRRATNRWSLRAWVGRVSGRSDRRLLHALSEATDAIATQCDLLADRIAARDTVSADVTDSFGEEVTRLRSEVLHLQRLSAAESEPRGD
jgi:hypothetical protein